MRSSPPAVVGVFLVSAVLGAVLFLTLAGPVRGLLVGGASGSGSVGAPQDEVVQGSGGAVGDKVELTAGTAGAGVGADGSATASAVDGAETAAGPPRTRVEADVQAVVDARASAWEATDPALLVDAVAAGSPALAADTQELERAQEADVRYPHVAFTVQDVQVVEREGERLRVAATVVRAALEVRDDEGWLLRTPEQVDQVELELVRQDGRWLLWSWTDEVR